MGCPNSPQLAATSVTMTSQSILRLAVRPAAPTTFGQEIGTLAFA
jgi:hypothetical protein